MFNTNTVWVSAFGLPVNSEIVWSVVYGLAVWEVLRFVFSVIFGGIVYGIIEKMKGK
jgi:hypothetical protein